MVRGDDFGASGKPLWGSSRDGTWSNSHLMIKATLIPLWKVIRGEEGGEARVEVGDLQEFVLLPR